MEDPQILYEFLKDSPLAVLVGLTIWQLTKVNAKLDEIAKDIHGQIDRA
jgi:cytochrome oxidase assembly protein ShyY1